MDDDKNNGAGHLNSPFQISVCPYGCGTPLPKPWESIELRQYYSTLLPPAKGRITDNLTENNDRAQTGYSLRQNYYVNSVSISLSKIYIIYFTKLVKFAYLKSHASELRR